MAPVLADDKSTYGARRGVGPRSGTVRALDQDGKPVWKAYTAGPIYYPPAVSNSRVYVGSADGRVYAYEATTGRMFIRVMGESWS